MDIAEVAIPFPSLWTIYSLAMILFDSSLFQTLVSRGGARKMAHKNLREKGGAGRRKKGGKTLSLSF